MNRTLLLITPTFVGFRVFLRELSQELSRRAWQVHLATSTTNYPDDHASCDDVQLHELDFPRGAEIGGFIRSARGLRNLVAQVRPTLIHAHFSAGILAAALARRPDWPITLGTFQGLIHPFQRGWRRRFYRQIERWAASRMDQTWVLTSDDLAALAPIPQVHLQQTPGFGVDLKRFDPGRFTLEDRRRVRAEWSAGEDDIVFIYVGRFVTFKGFAETARAALSLVREHPRVHFVFVGTEDPLHPSGLHETEWGQLRSQAHIHFVGWTEDVPGLLQGCDCLVFPSEREGMSVCIMEALCMGLPVITTSARGCGQLVRDGDNGWIVRQERAHIESRLRPLIADPSRLTPPAASALAERQRFSRTNYLHEQLGIYEKLVSSSESAPLRSNRSRHAPS